MLVAGNGDSIFKRLMLLAIGREDLANDPQLASNPGRVKRVVELDDAIAAYTRSRSVADVMEMLDSADVPGGRIYTVKDIAEDPHYRAREMIVSVTETGGRVDRGDAGYRAETIGDARCDHAARADARRRH